MRLENGGELVPLGGGDPIPLIRSKLTIGRRESCDIVLRFANVSGMHAELTYQDGYWLIRDLGSTNGIKVNDNQVKAKPLNSGDEITIASHRFQIQYTPAGTHTLQQILESEEEDVMDVPLLEKAGLLKPPRQERRPRAPGAADEDEDLE